MISDVEVGQEICGPVTAPYQLSMGCTVHEDFCMCNSCRSTQRALGPIPVTMMSGYSITFLRVSPSCCGRGSDTDGLGRCGRAGSRDEFARVRENRNVARMCLTTLLLSAVHNRRVIQPCDARPHVTHSWRQYDRAGLTCM